MSQSLLAPQRLSLSDLPQALEAGWRLFFATPATSLAYASVSVLIGFAILSTVANLGFSPLSLPLAGGFMLVAPAMLGGFFYLANLTQTGTKVTFATPFTGFLQTPLPLWIVALFCCFVFMIWLTDAGVLYSFMLGGADREALWFWFTVPDRSVAAFWFWGSLMGAFLAFVIFSVSAFSVPLLYERRAMLIQAITLSVRAVFSNFIVCMLWAGMLTFTTVTAILLLPVLLVLLPVLAYASFFLYRRVFPPAS